MQLPAQVLANVRRTSVPAHIRTLFSQLPQRLSISIELDEQSLPLAARQLLRLALGGEPWTLDAVQTGAPALRFVARRGELRCVLDDRVLSQELSAVVHVMVRGLFSVDELPVLLERLAFRSATLVTLQTITRHMLETTEIERALRVMLSGITAGYSLAFNRAVLFTANGGGHHVGTVAVGPWDEDEAHSIWEAIELRQPTIEDLISGAQVPTVETRLTSLVRSLSFDVTGEGADEFAHARRAEGPVLFHGPSRHPALAALHAGAEFVVAELRSHGRGLGFIFADDVFSGTPIHEERLSLLRFFIDQTALVWENLRLLKEVEDLARLDGLTGVLNRREFEGQLGNELARLQRNVRPCALIMVDLDHFKRINDEQGHAAGDAVLRAMAGILKDGVRTTDLVGRYGGDEFIVFLGDVERGQLRAAVERVGAAASQQGIPVSIGGTHVGGAVTMRELFAAADANLYRVKEGGRGWACLDEGERVDYGAVAR